MNSVKSNQPVGKQIMVNREIGLTLEQYFTPLTITSV